MLLKSQTGMILLLDPPTLEVLSQVYSTYLSNFNLYITSSKLSALLVSKESLSNVLYKTSTKSDKLLVIHAKSPSDILSKLLSTYSLYLH